MSAPPPPPPHALGNPAEAQPAPSLDPSALVTLLDRYPVQAAALLGAMRPKNRLAQAEAHAVHTGALLGQVLTDWAVLLASSPLCDVEPEADADSTVSASVYDPLLLASLHPDEARELVAALSEQQRNAQAVAQSAWMYDLGYDVSPDDYLTAWAKPPGELRRTG